MERNSQISSCKWNVIWLKEKKNEENSFNLVAAKSQFQKEKKDWTCGFVSLNGSVENWICELSQANGIYIWESIFDVGTFLLIQSPNSFCKDKEFHCFCTKCSDCNFAQINWKENFGDI